MFVLKELIRQDKRDYDDGYLCVRIIGPHYKDSTFGVFCKKGQKIKCFLGLSEDILGSIQEKHDQLDAIERKKELLKRILNYSKDMENIHTEADHFNRNRQLANDLKEMYLYQCQVCLPGEERCMIPPIVKRNGTPYVEVHHIKPLGSANESDLTEDELKFLDSPQNAIVLCSHHHKAIHYHEGGYGKLRFSEEQGLHFSTQAGSVLIVRKNQHLEAENAVASA